MLLKRRTGDLYLALIVVIHIHTYSTGAMVTATMAALPRATPI